MTNNIFINNQTGTASSGQIPTDRKARNTDLAHCHLPSSSTDTDADTVALAHLCGGCRP